MTLATTLHLAGISAEPVWAWDAILSRELTGRVIATGYLDGTYGYLPTAPMLREDGYEVRRLMEVYGLQGRFRPGFGSRVCEAWAALVRTPAS
jgi:hypothetical protein